MKNFEKHNTLFIKSTSVLIISLFLLIENVCIAQELNDGFKTSRILMIKTQIENRGIKDKKVLSAFLNVERHKFVPNDYINQAYDDNPLPIGSGQTISQPYIVAYMTDILKLSGQEKVLEIGTGSGYQAAILAELCDSVFTIEIFKGLGESAKKLLKELGYKNIFVKTGDGYKGWKEHAPFDAIIVTCAPTDIPKPLIEQLKEGGRMIIPVGKQWVQELILLRKVKGKIEKKEVLPVRFVPMIDSTGKSY